nr:GspH/FimT family pseudopilin [Halomonas sp. FL8]
MPPGATLRNRTRRAVTSQTGFTLIELLVAMGVLAIMATWAVPSYQQFVARNEVAAEVMRIRTALAMARNAAITRRTTVTVCPSADRLTCSSGDWTAPLVVIEGRAKGGDISDSEILKIFDGSHATSITYRKDGRPIRYGMLGWPTSHNGTFRICMKQGTETQVIVSNLGRVSVKNTQTFH